MTVTLVDTDQLPRLQSRMEDKNNGDNKSVESKSKHKSSSLFCLLRFYYNSDNYVDVVSMYGCVTGATEDQVIHHLKTKRRLGFK